MTIKRSLLAAVLAAAFTSQAFAAPPAEDEILEGDVRLACEAILCLSAVATARPAECMPSIRKYFSIVRRKPSETLAARLNFLRLCPKVDEEHVQQARRGGDQWQTLREQECRQKCSKDEYGYGPDENSLACMIKCRNDW